jgi:hypothetical protein
MLNRRMTRLRGEKNRKKLIFFLAPEPKSVGREKKTEVGYGKSNKFTQNPAKITLEMNTKKQKSEGKRPVSQFFNYRLTDMEDRTV